MVKAPKFDKPRYFGATVEGGPPRMPDSIQIAEGAILSLVYKGKVVTVKVSKVITPQVEFEGIIQTFDTGELEFEDLHHGDRIRFTHADIEHIH